MRDLTFQGYIVCGFFYLWDGPAGRFVWVYDFDCWSFSVKGFLA